MISFLFRFERLKTFWEPQCLHLRPWRCYGGSRRFSRKLPLQASAIVWRGRKRATPWPSQLPISRGLGGNRTGQKRAWFYTRRALCQSGNRLLARILDQRRQEAQESAHVLQNFGVSFTICKERI